MICTTTLVPQVNIGVKQLEVEESREDLRMYLVMENECLEVREGGTERRVISRLQRDSLEVDFLIKLTSSVGDWQLEGWIRTEVTAEGRTTEEKEWNIYPYKRICR